MYRHYIRVNSNNEVIAAFSDAFCKPSSQDILVRETEERHFNLNLLEFGEYRYIWDGKNIVRKPEKSFADQVKEIQKNSIVARLQVLDSIITRPLEDLYVSLKVEPHSRVREAIAEKVELRKALKGFR